MKRMDEKQRKAMFARLSGVNKFSQSGDMIYRESTPAEVFGMLGEKLASSVVKTYPGERTDGVVGLWPDRQCCSPALGDIVEGVVLDAYPDGMPIDNYGEAFAVGKSREWSDLNAGCRRFSHFPNVSNLSKAEYTRMLSEVDDGFAAGVIDANTRDSMISEIRSKRDFVD